jgi:hypothetical protein
MTFPCNINFIIKIYYPHNLPFSVFWNLLQSLFNPITASDQCEKVLSGVTVIPTYVFEQCKKVYPGVFLKMWIFENVVF